MTKVNLKYKLDSVPTLYLNSEYPERCSGDKTNDSFALARLNLVCVTRKNEERTQIELGLFKIVLTIMTAFIVLI